MIRCVAVWLTAQSHSLGQSGLKVSKVILGAMSYGSSDWAGWVKNEDEALPLLKAAFDMGINTWDTGELIIRGWCENGRAC